MIKELWKEKRWTREGKTFHHRQVYESEIGYIYEVSHSEDYSYPWYEVFKRKIDNSVKVEDGKLMRDESKKVVRYPSNEEFGRWAYCVDSMEKAMKCIKEWSIKR